MPLRPFPSPFRVGIDICDISRIQRLIIPQSSPIRGLQHNHLHRFLSRVFTDFEEEAFWERYLSKIENETFQSNHPASTYLAGRWAAKEAIIKACPRQITFHDIIISIQPDKKPYGIVLDHTRERQPLPNYLSCRHRRYLQKSKANSSLASLNGQTVPLSISHDGKYATAIALCPEESPFKGFSGTGTSTNLRRSFRPLDNDAT